MNIEYVVIVQSSSQYMNVRGVHTNFCVGFEFFVVFRYLV